MSGTWSFTPYPKGKLINDPRDGQSQGGPTYSAQSDGCHSMGISWHPGATWPYSFTQCPEGRLISGCNVLTPLRQADIMKIPSEVSLLACLWT